MTQIELERSVNKFLYMPAAEIEAALAAPETTMLDRMIANIIAQAALKGDQMRLDFVLNRLIGKVKDQIEFSLPKPFIVARSDGTQLELGAKLETEDE